MPSRFLAALLALTVAWMGLFCVEVAGLPSDTASVIAQAPGGMTGSVDDHHLDDLPSQALDGGPDLLQALPSDIATRPLTRAEHVRPLRGNHVLPPGVQDQLLRPPRAA